MKIDKQPFALALTGAALGWLVGQSGTPLLQTVLAGALASVSAVVATLAGLPGRPDGGAAGAPPPQPPQPRVTAWPLAAFLLAMSVASAASTWVRARGLLRPSFKTEISEWKDVGIPEPEIAYRLFATELPDPTRGNPIGRLSVNPTTVLDTWSAKLGLSKAELAHALLKTALDEKTDDDAAKRFDDHQKASEQVLMAGLPLEECATLRQHAQMHSAKEAFESSPRPSFREIAAKVDEPTLGELLNAICSSNR